MQSRSGNPSNLPRKIVLAVDGSDSSLKAAEQAIELAQLTKAAIVALHVVLLPQFASEDTLADLRKDLSAKASDMLEQVGKMGEARGVEVDRKIVQTDRSVVQAISSFAMEEKAGLIVLGTKGISGVPKMMLGSVAAGVVSAAHWSVLAVR